MKDVIVVNVNPDHNTESGSNILGREGEGKASQLEIFIPERLREYDIYIDFKKPNGETVRTPRLELAGSVAIYEVPQFLLSESGIIEMQLVFQSENEEVWKSSVRRYTIVESINAVEEIPNKEDFITEAQRILDAFSEEVNEIADMLANNADFVGTVAHKIDSEGTELRSEINKLYAIIVGNAWKLNETFEDEIFESNLEYTLNFASNGQHFAKIEFSKTTNANGIDTHLIHYCDADGNRTRVYTTNKTNRWEDEAYRDIVTEDAVSLDRVATRAKQEEETDAITLVGAINELGDKVETNETAIERLNKLPAIIFETEEDIAELANKLNTDAKTIIGAINELVEDVDKLNKQYDGMEEDANAICIPFETRIFGVGIEFGGLYINIVDLKIYIKIADYRYDITDWKQVQDIIKWIDDTGEDIVTWVNETGEGIVTWVNETGEVAVAWIDDTGKVVAKWVDETGKVVAEWVTNTGEEVAGWVNGVGETIKDVINTICKALWLPEPFPENEEPNKESAEMAGQLIAGAVEAQKKVFSPAWKMKDTFEDTDIFEYEFDFKSNDINFNKMRSTYANGVYLIHYIRYVNGAEKKTTAYSSLKSGGWMKEEYQTVYACNPSAIATSNAILSNIAGASWKLNEELNPNIREFELNCDFIANNVTYKKIIVKLALRVGYSNPDYEFDTIEYVRKEDGVSVCVYYYNPHKHTGGWLNPISKEYDNPTSLYRNIVVLAPTDNIAYSLRKIGVEVTEKFQTSSQTMAGSVNELFHNIGNLGDLEIEEVSKYSMSRSVEEEEEAPEQDTLVKAINRVYRRTVAMQETIDELDEKVGESVDTSNLQSKTDETLETNSKEIVGAINESFRKSKQVADIVIPKVIVTDLKDTTWKFNNTMSGFIMARNIKFISNGVTYTQMQAMGDLNSGEYAISYDTTKVYSASTGWIDEAYQNVTYIEGTQLTYSNFINWNNNNGELIKDIALDTEAQTLVEAINEINSKVGGSSSKSIIDVTELPTENINEEAFYRLLTGKWVFDGEVYNSYTCYCVDNLPEVGEVATTDMVTITAYYCVADGVVYGYVDDMLGGYFSIPSGWYSADMLFSVAGIGYGGVVTNMADTALDGVLRLLLDYSLYTHKQGKWETLKGVGQAGTGMNAEVFNGILNEAKGDFSHARGRGTVAEGACSSASGRTTLAQGDYSSAEGLETASLGDASHTEGFGTSAIGDFSHAQGKFNLLDDEGKYAHIVGNGKDGARSNAHTIDWQGNGWFAGTIKVGGTGQDDENAKELATKEYVDSKIGGSDEDTITITFNDNLTDIVFGTYFFSFEFTHQGETKLGYGMQFQNWGGSGAHLHYLIANGESITVCTRYPGGEMNNWYGEEYKKITASAMPTDETLLAIFNTNTTVQGSPSSNNSNGLEMPQIRFTSATGSTDDGLTPNLYVNEVNPLKLTVEIVGGGALQVGDQLQVCHRKRFNGSRANDFRRKYKLQRFAEYVVTEEDLDKQYLTVSITCNLASEDKMLKHAYRGLFHDGMAGNIAPLYLRIRRAKGNMQTNDSGQTVDAEFSNIVTIWKHSIRGNQTIRIQ